MTTINMNRLHKLFPRLTELAKTSDINHQHAAVIISNGNPVAWGINMIKGKHTHHAECAAIHRYLISRGNLGYVKESCILRKSWQRQYCQKGTQKYSATT